MGWVGFEWGGGLLDPLARPPPQKKGSIDRTPLNQPRDLIVQTAVVFTLKDTWSPVNYGYTSV